MSAIPGNEKQKTFLDLLDILGFILRVKPIKIIHLKNGQKLWKGNLDIELSLEMIDTISSYKTAILVSGDSDFAPVVDRVKRKEKKSLTEVREIRL
ncbi:NYN domain-containing protein [Patescibacteria group bacterium]|nr:NYN domain-containing protein [Patescibacteria group bacterium]